MLTASAATQHVSQLAKLKIEIHVVRVVEFPDPREEFCKVFKEREKGNEVAVPC